MSPAGAGQGANTSAAAVPTERDLAEEQSRLLEERAASVGVTKFALILLDTSILIEVLRGSEAASTPGAPMVGCR